MFYWFVRFLALILFKILFRLQVFGRENIPAKGGFILASNHRSYLDPPIVGAGCPRALYFLAKEGLFKNLLFDRFISALNTLPVKGNSNDLKSLRLVIKELKKGKALTIFPEGARIADESLGAPSEGVGFLAAKAKVPIVPTFVEGSNRALPINSKFIHFKKIRIYFGQPIFVESLGPLEGGDVYQRIADTVMKEIKRLKEFSRCRNKKGVNC